MSTKEITITTKNGNILGVLVVRRIECKIKRQGFLTIEKHFFKKFYVQYGIGTSGQGDTLKAAISDFQKNWIDFCNSRFQGV